VNIQRKETAIPYSNYISNNQFTLFENHSDAICVIDLQGAIIYANLSISNLLGYSTEALLNLKFQEFICSDNGFAIFNFYFQKAVESDTEEFITEIKCKDGQIKEMKIITISNETDGRIVSISVFVIDISAAKGSSDGVSPMTMGLCESFIENNRDPILLLNLDAIIILANQAFSKLLGWRKENLEGFHILQCPSIPANLVEQMGEYFRRIIDGETDLTTLDTIRIDTEGKPYYMMLSITPIKNSKGNLCNWAVHLRDISAQKEAEQLLLRHISDYEQTAIGIADQIRNPIHSLKEIMESIKSKNRDIECVQQLGRMTDELNRIESLIRTFLNSPMHDT
jgi:two-component system sporulation sensor kinase A